MSRKVRLAQETLLEVPLEEKDPLFNPQRLHDLRNAASRVRAVLGLLDLGYKFDDERADRNKELLKQAHETLTRAFDELEPLFLAQNDKAASD